MAISNQDPDSSSAFWKVLIIDDEEDEYILARSMLKKARGRKFDIHWASTFAAGRDELVHHHYDAVLVDYELGIHSGIEVIREANERGCDSPLILYTGQGSYEVDVEAMQAGATLYLAKGEFNPLLLERAIRYAVELKSKEQVLRESKQQLQEANELLEKRIRERTFELMNAQDDLRQRNSELEQALVKEKALRIQLVQAEKNAALARLIASIAHEINNPLQTVRNSLYLLKMDLSAQDAQEVLDMAYTESQRMSDLVQQLRETYRPSDMIVVDFDLCEILNKVLRLLEPQFHQNHVEVSVENRCSHIPIHGIPDRIHQVFLNICLNAIDAIGSKGGS